MRTIKRFVLLSSLICSSCTPMYNIPFEDEVRRLEELPAEGGKFDCVDKSVLYHNFLRLKGVESRIVSGKVKGLPDGTIHAWVEVYNPKYNEWYIVDPTLSGLNDSNDGLRVSYPKKDRKKWVDYSNDITPEDIRNHKKISKVYRKNIPRDYIGNFDEAK